MPRRRAPAPPTSAAAIDAAPAASTHVVVDGSNIATEGRTLPSLTQLDDAVRAFMSDHPHDRVTVVVDATFGHRIDASERVAFDAAVNGGELITPPAGAIGRGDAFVLQIADRASATVLSNDSFQEFHGAYPWLFDEGRLIGGKPVPGIGWIFVLRTPVRGPMSRRAVQAAKKKSATPAKEAAKAPEPKVAKATPAKSAAKAGASGRARAQSKGPAPESPPRATTRSRRRRGDAGVEPLNEPMVFIDFVAAHPVGATVEGVVERFSSHGAYVTIGDARAYLALKSMGDPPPRSAREVLTLGETRSFVVQSIDTPRRGIDVALRETAHKTDSGSTAAKATADAAVGKSNKRAHAQEAPVAPAAKKAPARRTAAKKAPARRTAAKKAPARRTAAKKTTARRSPAKKATARKAPAKRATAKRAPARKTAAKKTTARKAPAKRATAKRAPARKTAAKKTTARKTTARKAPARKTAARKTTARKTTARKAPARRTAKRTTKKS
jgi:hypothetical protein